MQKAAIGHATHFHSHNDEQQQVEPLFDALKAGCTSIEADVWGLGGDLLVGHSFVSLRPWLKLENTYLEPLLRLLDEANIARRSEEPVGLFPDRPEQSLVLVLDIKNAGYQTNILQKLNQLLQPFRDKDYLTYADHSSHNQRPLTIVAGGRKPRPLLEKTTSRRDIFFNIHTLPEPGANHPDLSGAFGLALSFRKAVGPVYGRLSEEQVLILRRNITAAHERGLKVRVWGVPDRGWSLEWPVQLQEAATLTGGLYTWYSEPGWPNWAPIRERIWDVLADEDVDHIDVDDLAAAQRWAKKRNGGTQIALQSSLV